MVTHTRVEATISAQNKLRPGLVSAARDLDRFRGQQSKAATAFASTAARALGAVGGAYAAMSGAQRALKSSVSLEREMYNVQRATDSSGEALKAQEQAILDLARATGKTKEELAQLYAAAGFAGRPAHELGQFTDYAAKATVAWGTNAQETGQALAEIGNIYEANQRRIEAIGDAINTVADSSASSEKDLVEILRRVGGAGKGLGISAENMLAFGAALKEVGVGTEVASTGLNAMLTKISVADDKFDEALKKVGLQPKKFRDSVDKDATGSIMTLLKALSKIDGTKRISVLKDMFGMEYADDISRMVGGLDRITKLLGIANDKARSLGSVRSGFGLALQKDFNKLDRATQSMDVLMVRVGNHLKEIGGGFAEVINKAVDSSEKAKSRLDRLKELDQEADDRAGKPRAQAAQPAENPLDPKVMDRRALESINDPRTDDDSLRGLSLYGGTDEIRNRAEDAYRRRRYAAADKESLSKERELTGKADALTARSVLAGPDSIHADRIVAARDEAERLRQSRLQRELEGMHKVPLIRGEAGKAAVGLQSQQRLGSFGNLPITIGQGRNAKTYQAPTADAPGFDGVKSAVNVDLSSQGAQAAAQFGAALNAGLDKVITEATGKIESLKAMLSFTASPTVRLNMQSAGLGGLNTGKGMTEVR
jgi:TP901 family phage tail tape measure protein